MTPGKSQGSTTTGKQQTTILDDLGEPDLGMSRTIWEFSSRAELNEHLNLSVNEDLAEQLDKYDKCSDEEKENALR